MINCLIDRRFPVCASLLVVGLFCIFLTTGCAVVYSEKNRPGDIDISEPPTDNEEPARELPEHPGASFLTTQFVPFLDLGGTFGGLRTNSWTTRQTGAELTVGAGTTADPPPVHTPELFQNPALHYSGRSYQLAVGWLFHSTQDLVTNRAYAELRIPLFLTDAGNPSEFRLGVGWSVQPASQDHGPQLTIGLAELSHIRLNWNIGQGWSLMYGFRLPLTFAYVQSR